MILTMTHLVIIVTDDQIYLFKYHLIQLHDTK